MTGGPTGPPRPATAGRGDDAGVAGNERLTGSTAAVLLVLLAAEGVTVLQVRPLLTPHVFIGLLLVPPVLLKIGSTGWRFVRYYTGSPPYRRRGAPVWLLRLLGPFVVVLTVALFGTGIALLLEPGHRSSLLFLHQASFVAWLVVMTIHVLGHLVDTARLAPRDWAARTRARVPHAGVRQATLLASLATGLILAAALVGKVTPYLAGTHQPFH